jgi:hypothetical protein
MKSVPEVAERSESRLLTEGKDEAFIIFQNLADLRRPFEEDVHCFLQQ